MELVRFIAITGQKVHEKAFGLCGEARSAHARKLDVYEVGELDEFQFASNRFGFICSVPGAESSGLGLK